MPASDQAGASPGTIRIDPIVELELVAAERDNLRNRCLLFGQHLAEERRENAALRNKIAELEPRLADQPAAASAKAGK